MGQLLLDCMQHDLDYVMIRIKQWNEREGIQYDSVTNDLTMSLRSGRDFSTMSGSVGYPFSSCLSGQGTLLSATTLCGQPSSSSAVSHVSFLNFFLCSCVHTIIHLILQILLPLFPHIITNLFEDWRELLAAWCECIRFHPDNPLTK